MRSRSFSSRRGCFTHYNVNVANDTLSLCYHVLCYLPLLFNVNICEVLLFSFYHNYFFDYSLIPRLDFFAKDKNHTRTIKTTQKSVYAKVEVITRWIQNS